jgi:seryl-tRNA synthetase
MIDPRILRENPQIIHEMLEKRKTIFPLKDLIDLDEKRREVITMSQDARHKKNVLSLRISKKKKEGLDVIPELEEMKDIGKKISSLNLLMSSTEKEFNKLMFSIPNLLDDSVPIGKDSNDNVVVRVVGKPSEKKFRYLDHVDLCTSLDLFDLERAAKVAGARFYFLKNDLVKLNLALINYALDFLEDNGYTLIQPPYLLNQDAVKGAVILSDFQDVIYKVDQEDLYMIGTSEHAIAAMRMEEILNGRELPLRYGSISPCFRKEAGAHGKDMKGIFRVHQFEKVEQFVYCKPEDSRNEHERMLALTEKFYQSLGIPYRVTLLCSADIGKVSAKTYDIEAWFPGQDAYREIVSCSNCTDYQSRRLAVRYKDKTNEDTRFVHTLNCTLVATERTMVALMENYQTASGGITIPTVLRGYLAGKTEISPKNEDRSGLSKPSQD